MHTYHTHAYTQFSLTMQEFGHAGISPRYMDAENTHALAHTHNVTHTHTHTHTHTERDRRHVGTRDYG
jgi:hypothetical protein